MAQAEKLLLTSDSIHSTPVQDGNELTWHSDYSTGAQADVTVRKSRGYLLVHGIDTAGTPAQNEIYCYFYNQLK